MKKIILVALFIAITTLIFAQQGQGRQERLEQLKAQKIAFITQELNLTPKEAQVFWPIFNEFEAKRNAIKKEKHFVMKQCRKGDGTLTDKDYEQIANQYVKSELEMAKLIEEYNTKFQEILAIKKVVMLYHTEQQFKRKLINQIGGRGRNCQKN